MNLILCRAAAVMRENLYDATLGAFARQVWPQALTSDLALVTWVAG